MIGTAKLASLAGELIQRARERAEPVADRITAIRVDPPPVRLTHLVIIGLAWPLSLWGWGKWCERGRDTWWRGRIAETSTSVREIVRQGGEDATTTDDKIIEGLKDADRKRREAESALEVERERPRAPERDLCRVPADCLAGGLRQQ